MKTFPLKISLRLKSLLSAWGATHMPVPLVFLYLLVVLPIAAAVCIAKTDTGAERSNLSGRIEAGFLYLSTTSQLLAEKDNKNNTDLDQEAGSTGTFYIPLLFEFRYAFNQSKTSVYAETPNESIRGALRLGLTHHFRKDEDIFDFAFFFEPDKVWKNPFETSTSREDTPVYNTGIKAAYEKVLGSRFNVSYKMNHTDVDKDVIGNQTALLRRDGHIHTLGFTYTIPYNQLNSFTPGFSYIEAEMKGRSNSYNGFHGELAYLREKANYGIYTFIALDHKGYDAIHPIFMKERSEDIYSSGLIVTFYKAFNNNNAFTRLGLGYEYADANIDFYDYQTIALGFSIGYFF